ncbi:alcohol dehydrogenase class IV [Roseiarcus fermentans]|uniref:Alcohol dehydrogenase class IV n=1 Tax=Roseiarcus fermentans TaxID=1473586 RepID=A0A366EY38_9HYPH|nr:iron-containing alcohol dehydrogenase [Roseiarcus fermentans]RBP07301.1 alcohol dehydrogenase class IV [Roseiarcus fermentans]
MTLDNRLGLGFVRQPKFVLFGPGQRRQLGLMAKGLGRRALVITDERMATTAEFKGMLESLSREDVAASVYDKALPDLPRSNIVEVVSLFRDKDVDLVIGVGGGSCMDLAKTASIVLANGGDVRDYYGEFRVPGPGLPIIAVPTTGGTGAEVTSIAVIFDDETNMKMAITDAHLEPTAAIIDPELTLTCPRGLTAATAADAISHLVEGFTARPKNPTPEELATKIYVGKNRITDIFCIKGLELMNRSVGRVVADPSDLEARSDVMFAAYCAGMVINTTGTAAAHAIQSPIAAFSHAPHGFGVGALLPYVMRLNLPYCTSEFAEIGRVLGVAAPDQPELRQARAGIARIEELLAALGAPLDLKAIEVRPENFQTIAESSLKASRLVLNNPAPMTMESVMAVLRRGYDDDRSWWTAP